MQLLMSDLFKDFPTLRFIIPHGGGAVPYHWGRFRGIAQDAKRRSPRELMGANVFFDTCVYHKPGIELLLEVVPVWTAQHGVTRLAEHGLDRQPDGLGVLDDHHAGGVHAIILPAARTVRLTRVEYSRGREFRWVERCDRIGTRALKRIRITNVPIFSPWVIVGPTWTAFGYLS
jgi:hypothetical protein